MPQGRCGFSLLYNMRMLLTVCVIIFIKASDTSDLAVKAPFRGFGGCIILRGDIKTTLHQTAYFFFRK